MKKSPLTVVKDKFESKAKLVAAVESFSSDDLWVARTNKDKGLAHVSNAKLLRLHATFSTVKEKFGTRAKLIDAILEIEKRVKDEGYRKHLSAHPVPRLWDLYRTLERKRKASAADAPKKAAKPVAEAPKKAAKKAPAKKAAGKKTASKKA